MKHKSVVFAACAMAALLAACAASGTAGYEIESTDAAMKRLRGAKAGYSKLFSGDTVSEVRIIMPDKEWNTVLTKAYCSKLYRADAVIGGEVIRGAAIASNGFDILIKTDGFKSGQTLSGLDSVILSGFADDPSYMRSYIMFDAMCEIQLEAPLVSYAEVSANDGAKGLYLMREPVGASFLNRVFLNSDGGLYLAQSGATLLPDSGGAFAVKSQNGCKAAVDALISALDSMPYGQKGDIEQVLDVSSALKYLAVSAVLEDGGSYLGADADGYYLYENNGVFFVIPDTGSGALGAYTAGKALTSIEAPSLGAEISQRPLAYKLLSISEYKNEYLRYVKSLTAYLQLLDGRVDELEKTLFPHIRDDRMQHGLPNGAANAESSRALMDFVGLRVEELLRQLSDIKTDKNAC